MISDIFVPELQDMDVKDLWYLQQNDATCHRANQIINLLKQTFGVRIISRRVSVAWPTRSCHFAPLDYPLWGYV